jgi:hypothetical protein
MLLRVRRALFTLAVLSVLLAGCGDSTKKQASAATDPTGGDRRADEAAAVTHLSLPP